MKLDNKAFINDEKNIDSNIFFQNNFSKKILNLNADIIKNKTNNGNFNLDEIKYTRKEKFIIETVEFIIEIHNKSEDLNYVFIHIDNYPTNKEYRKKIPIEKYVSYHIEIYLIKFISLFDRILHLINFIYNLNYKNNSLNLKNIKKKNINRKLLNILEKFNGKIKKIREEQNKIKHSGTININELKKVGYYEFILNNSKDLDKNSKKQLENYIKLAFNNYKFKLKKDIFNNTIFIADFINEILEELYLKFEEKLNNFKT